MVGVLSGFPWKEICPCLPTPYDPFPWHSHPVAFMSSRPVSGAVRLKEQLQLLPGARRKD